MGNGNGGASGYARSGGYIKENGGSGTVYKFNDSSLGLAGGGGGGGAGYGRGIKPEISLEYGGTSGQPNTGGHGGYETLGTNDDERGYDGQNGGIPGGGGGGGTGMVWGGTYTDYAGYGGDGGAGIIYLRWTVQEVSA